MVDRIDKRPLSGSSSTFRPISVGNAGTNARTTIHTGIANAVDEVHLWISNSSGAGLTVVVEHGSQGSTQEYRQSITNGNGLNYVCPGLLVSGTGDTITAYCSSPGSGTNIHGFVNRMTW